MRVLLITPTQAYKHTYPVFSSSSDFPVGFAYLASALKTAGHEVFGLNPNNVPGYKSAYEMLYDRISRCLKENQPELIGLGGLCIDFKFLKDAIHIIRTLAPDIPVVCGGGIINHDAEFVFRTLHPDFCIIGEGEEVLVQLADMLEMNKQDYGQIPNLGYWEQGVSEFTRQDSNYGDINQRTFPDYEPFGFDAMLDLDNRSLVARYLYRYTRANPRPIPIVTARGCPFSCTFCIHKGGLRYRSRSIDNIIQEITSLYARYHFNILIIIDELFVANKMRLREFCDALICAKKKYSWDFDWSFQTHANASLDEEILKLAKQAGAYFFSYGIESASPKVLVSMNKHSMPSQIAKAIELSQATEIGFGGNFIFGDVAETTETISESLNFFWQHCKDIHVFLFDVQPYPGSKLFEHCLEKGIIQDKVEFYEHIEETIFNMTSIPDELWIPWLKRMVSLGNSFSWIKSQDAFRCTKELESTNNYLFLHRREQVWKVWVKCPHCNKEAYYRERLRDIKRKKTLFLKLLSLPPRFIKAYHREKDTGRTAVHNLCSLVFTLVKHRIKRENPLQEAFSHPLFKLLDPFTMNEKHSSVSFVTGCPHCHRRFGVNINDGKRC
jgi:radical SAM superfamily enzyme YgiQ (UPF0313 family)